MDSNSFWNQETYTPQTDWSTLYAKPSEASQAAKASTGGMPQDAENLGWLAGPKGAAAMYALKMISDAQERRRKERIMQYESRVAKLRGQQQAAASGQQMAQALRF